MKASKIWALVLMGGGARGLAHIGVLRVLEDHGLVPDVIAGTSMGALVGGLFAAGLSGDKLTKMLDGMGLDEAADKARRRGPLKRSRNLFEYLLLSDYRNRIFSKIGVDKGDAIEAYLKSCVGSVRIEDLPIKFMCNAVDLVSGREILFTRGKLCRALRATMSLPLVFAPVRMGGMLLLDGGILTALPSRPHGAREPRSRSSSTSTGPSRGCRGKRSRARSRSFRGRSRSPPPHRSRRGRGTPISS